MLKLALSIKWLGALLLCLLLAGIFAALAQWQVTRSVIPNADNDGWDKVEVLALEEIAKVGEPYTFIEISYDGKEKVLAEVHAEIYLSSSQAVLVGNRIQLDGRQGYWLVVPASTTSGKVFVAVGFVEGEENARDVLEKVNLPIFTTAGSSGALLGAEALTGRYIPSEAPQEYSDPKMFESLSVAQLINIWFAQDESKESDVYTGVLALTHESQFSSIPKLEPITIGVTRSDTQINWLSAFYAIEWTVFALFALFIWWRLLSDAYIKQQSKIGE
ncbi:MAG: hypothetical protein RJA78_596 [Actinomycetota bacterium]|jgi:cytochrome oxidase assembly protein ShyY1